MNEITSMLELKLIHVSKKRSKVGLFHFPWPLSLAFLLNTMVLTMIMMMIMIMTMAMIKTIAIIINNNILTYINVLTAAMIVLGYKVACQLFMNIHNPHTHITGTPICWLFTSITFVAHQPQVLNIIPWIFGTTAMRHLILETRWTIWCLNDKHHGHFKSNFDIP